MFRRLRWFIGRNWSTKRLPNADQPPNPTPPPSPLSPPLATFPSPPVKLDTVHEIAIYIHRFHNLDLFQQGWYQIKITLRLEDSEYTTVGVPARVIQYEAPELAAEDTYGVWRIDDTENSFSTQPFRIKYSRQDVYLSIMIAFNLSVSKYEGLSTSAVILKFELLYASMLGNGSELQSSADTCPAAVHEFRIPPKALLGLHSYCPVHFDAFHTVLVDISVHISLLKASASVAPLKADFVTHAAQGQLAAVDSQQIMLIKALMAAYDILLDDFGRISKAIDQAVDSIDFTSKSDHMKLLGSVNGEASAQLMGRLQNGVERADATTDLPSDGLSYFLSSDDLLNSFHMLGNQILYLWNSFLMFHRLWRSFLSLMYNLAFPSVYMVDIILLSKPSSLLFVCCYSLHSRANKMKIMEFLRDAWANDRKAEWSIWMVYSKVDMPHHFISGVDESSYQGIRAKALSMRKFNVSEDPAQSAAMRAELHRRSIAQMRINNRSLQDMHIFGDPSRIPIVIVERVVSAPLRSTSGHSYFSHLDPRDNPGLFIVPSVGAGKKATGTNSQQSGRVLKIVVFVHGFQLIEEETVTSLKIRMSSRMLTCSFSLVSVLSMHVWQNVLVSKSVTNRTHHYLNMNTEQGHHLDLRLVRNQWLFIDPKIEYLMSEANEDKTYGDFREMGLRLAEEVITFVKKKMDKAARSGNLRDIKLSFVGHSIGNIIIRSALAESMMEPYLRYLYTYVSISGPHLGYLYSSNSLFNSGLWLLKKLKGTQCIHQLTFSDDPDLQNTFFYKLCKHKTLENFRNIILLSSPQDGYVPYHSARIEVAQASLWDYSRKGKIFLEMLNNCLDQIRAPSSDHRVFMRFDINFDISSHGRNLNTLIGRAAHIEFLETDIFARFIMWSFPELFR
ncbi:hypothetical protein JRO89_XS02G0187000 [Xanthoceras sorbifolium]|uniref:DUF676 domain-containing protein n=1 Tax=Xanthoceras sorbifolium TaxID=99658 RepID=A0ABQ8IGL1_9ROSI|nr:hypothetical protein JRO89_XS02G0187000 [Xanthoceras sorbifolium]